MAYKSYHRAAKKRRRNEPDQATGASSNRKQLRGHSYLDQIAMLSPYSPMPRYMDHSRQNDAAVDSPSLTTVRSEEENLAHQQSGSRDHNPTFTADLYEKHQKLSKNAKINEGISKWTVEFINLQWLKNKGRYEHVAHAVDMPAELICAIHIREASGHFNTYLHQGDPLGRPAVNHPANIPIFHKWEDAAIHALQMRHQNNVREDLGIVKETTDLAAMSTFAEYYNGLGYHNKGRTSPYVYAKTDQYESGKYVADGKYDPNAVDENPGVLAILMLLNNPDFAVDTRPLTGGSAARPHGN